VSITDNSIFSERQWWQWGQTLWLCWDNGVRPYDYVARHLHI